MYKLHYEKVENNGDIPCHNFGAFTDLEHYMMELAVTSWCDRVYVFAAEDKVFVHHELDFMRWHILPTFKHYSEIHLQEYHSYEEAYKVALDMREPYAMCYRESATPKNNLYGMISKSN